MALSYRLAVPPAPCCHPALNEDLPAHPAPPNTPGCLMGANWGLSQSFEAGLPELFTGLFVQPLCHTALCPGCLERALVPGSG